MMNQGPQLYILVISLDDIASQLYSQSFKLLLVVVLQDTCYQAMYDYNAEEDDEVSFIEGDIIVSPHFSHYEGWMMGCVERTGLNGLFPLNYVQRIA